MLLVTSATVTFRQHSRTLSVNYNRLGGGGAYPFSGLLVGEFESVGQRKNVPLSRNTRQGRATIKRDMNN